ncbi:intermembrane phospholipid transport protein YdbH family protein [Desulfosediminicola ganghwensis]|uniref:intermembrane phospholipid transport protein YdbH family protein n=1 Tax=Desulfosediminicola ganghwensis TaxID=2569540 RepID=UPI0010AD89A8|nr:YdbH domain-containing protein [Desulfosediminicola ganghwensis]
MSRFYSSRKFYKALATVPIGLLLISWLLFCSLPFLLNTYIIPSVLQKHGFNQLSVHIQSLSPTSLTGNLALGDKSRQSLSVSRFEITFNPLKAVKGTIESILIDGALLHLGTENGKLSLQGFSIDTAHDKVPAENAAFDLSTILPFTISTIDVRNCQIFFDQQDRPGQLVVIDGHIKPSFIATEQKTVLDKITINLQSQGNVTGSASASIDINQDIHSLDFSIELKDLGQLASMAADFGAREESLRLRGSGYLNGSAEFHTSSSSLENIEAQLQVSDFLLADGDITLLSDAKPLQFDLAGNSEQLHYTITNLSALSPLPANLALSGIMVPAEVQLTGQGEITSDMFEQPISLSMTLGPDGKNYSGGITLSGDYQRIAFAGQQAKKHLELGKYRLISEIVLDRGKIHLENSFKLSSFTIPELELKGSDVQAAISYSLTGVNGIAERALTPGTISIGSLLYRDERMARLHANVAQRGQSIRLSGSVTSLLANPLNLNFEATISPTFDIQASLKLEEQSVNTDSLPSFIPLPEGLEFEGKLAAQAKIEVVPRQTNWNLQLQIKDGEVTTGDDKLKLSGINSELTFPGFANFASSPSQQLRINNLEAGNIKLTNGLITFHLEDSQTIFIEKSRFTWCSGKVESGSLRFSINDPEISTVLYCDRLQFSELLGQLGISEAGGNGSLNGRLPIYYSEKEIIFDDGFLFSTPGDSGIVRLSNTSMLRQGMGDMGQSAYLDYSLQSMENFSYNWTKLTFNTKGEDLLIAMQIDGKPANPLPYGYKKGQLVKMEGAGIQHPIRLDVNFHLPFAQMLKYGQNLQKIMENM